MHLLTWATKADSTLAHELNVFEQGDTTGNVFGALGSILILFYFLMKQILQGYFLLRLNDKKALKHC